MAWQRPVCALRAAKNQTPGCQLEPFLRTRFSPRSSPGRHANIASPFYCQRRLESTSPTELAPAAPPFDFDNPTESKRIPARILPVSPSYFTGNPKYIDHLLKLEHIQSKYAGLPTAARGEAPRVAWLRLTDFRNAIGENVPASKYKKLQKLLHRINQIRPDLRTEEVNETLDFFTRPGDPFQSKVAPRAVDDLGRAKGRGRRKTSHCQVWLVEGDGQVLVNNRSILDVFPRLHDRESALWALRSTNRLDKYNVWALVRGGGVTGQAEALTNAVARALIVHEPALKTALRQAGCITTDPRQVERKKPGHLKARKMPTWVKR